MVDKVQMETWKNPGKATVAVMKLDPLGQEKSEVVAGGMVLNITPQERAMNQDRAASTEQDLFQNGMLIPLRLLEGDESAAELASNVNLISESEIDELFKLNWRGFDKKLNEISNALTLSRILDRASANDATVRQVESLKAKIADLDPTIAPQNDQILGNIRKDKDEKFKAGGLSDDDQEEYPFRAVTTP